MDLAVVMDIILLLLLSTAIYSVPVAIYRYAIRKDSLDSTGTAIIVTIVFFLVGLAIILFFCFGGDYVYDDYFPFLMIPSIPCICANYLMLAFPKKKVKTNKSSSSVQSDSTEMVNNRIHELYTQNNTLRSQNDRLTRINREQSQDIEKLTKQLQEIQKQNNTLQQQLVDSQQFCALMEKREADISELEKKQALWMDSFECGHETIGKTTQAVVDLYHDIQRKIDPILTNIRAMNSSTYIPSYELKNQLTNAQTVIQEQQHLLLSYTQTLASYLHHFDQRTQALREQEERANKIEAKLLDNSPYIVEKAFDNIFVRTGNAFYQAQAMALNRYYERVKDKRFEKALIENIHYTTGPTVICRIKSNDKNHPAPYITSLSTCTCQDFRRYKQPCKHMLFLAYHTGYMFLNKEKLESSMKQYVDEIKKK